MSMRLCDEVIVRKRMQNKSHNYVKKSRAFGKGHIGSELMITPIRWTLTKSRYKLIFGHSLWTLTTGVVRMLYPQNTEHLRYNIWSDHEMRTSNASNKKRY